MMQRPLKPQAGMTLIEVLVAILIFSFGLLGFVGLQARAIQYSTSAEDSNRAALLANEMASSLMLSQSVTPTAAALTAWQTRVADTTGNGLPSGQGTVSTTGTVATITITWQAPTAASGAVNSVNKYVTQVVQ
jgi:type IV pilus assembly protein PilV